MSTQCPAVSARSGVRCELPIGHASTHVHISVSWTSAPHESRTKPRYRIDRLGVRPTAAHGRYLSRAELLALPEDVWEWLRLHGVRRPSPSGPSGTAVPHARRRGRRVEVYLGDDASAALDRGIGRHGSARAAIESALMSARMGGGA